MTPEVEQRVLRLGKLCSERSLTIGCAESCTGGLLSSWICAFPGVSSFYQGCVVSYARTVKRDLLSVPESLLKTHGEVSGVVALAMAVGAKRALISDWAVSVTGVAGPNGGTLDKPVGLVWFAVVGPGFERVVSQQFGAHGGRQDIQRQAALFAFDFLISALI